VEDSAKTARSGLMQVMPAVGREWAAETGIRDLQNQMQADPQNVLKDPERNIQIGCWYLEKIYAQFRDDA
jgi:soluble lytic murein transglycosylase